MTLEKEYFVPVDMHGLQIINHRLHMHSSNPGSPNEGDIWYNSTNHEPTLRATRGSTSSNRALISDDDDFYNRLSTVVTVQDVDELMIWDDSVSPVDHKQQYRKITRANFLSGMSTIQNAYKRVIADTDTQNLDASGEDDIAIAGDGTIIETSGSVNGINTLALVWKDQTENYILAGPASDGADTPTFRTLVDADMPTSYSPDEWDTAYSHSLITENNPHNVTYAEIGGLWDRNGTILSPLNSGDSLAVNIINEENVDTGVTIEGALIKDSLMSLDHITSPSGNWSMNLANKQLRFLWVAPVTGAGAMELEVSGAFSGDVLHIHQHTGNPGAGSHLLHLEADDPDICALFVDCAGTVAAAFTKAVKVDTLNEYTLNAGIVLGSVLYVDQENSRVGINDTSPSYQLDVNGTGRFTGDLTLTGATSHLILPQNNDAATPTLAFGDGNTGFYERSDNSLVIGIGGTARWIISGDSITGRQGRSVYITGYAGGGVSQPVYAFYEDYDTGMYSPSADVLSLVAGGVEQLRLTQNDAAVDVAGFTGNVEIAGSIKLLTGATVDTIETTLTDDDTHLPTSGAVVDHVANAIVGGLTYKGGYNAATNTPDLDSSPSGVLQGDTYTVTVDGVFFTDAVQAGDMLIAEVDDANELAEWTIVNKNIPPYNFLNLTDTPANYISSGGFMVMINSAPDGLEFIDPSGYNLSNFNDDLGHVEMAYPGAGIALSTGSAWDTSITNNSGQWNTAYTHSQIAGGNSVHVSTTENTNWDTAYSHTQVDNQAHVDYMRNVGDTAVGNYDITGLVQIGTTSAGKHLEFRRASANYICAPSSGSFYFMVNGDVPSSADAILRLNSNYDIKIGRGSSNTAYIYLDDSADKVGIGTTSPDGTLHVHTATAGAVTAHADADDLVIEGSGNTGITILTPAANIGRLNFGDQPNNDIASIRYDHSVNKMFFDVSGTTDLFTISIGGFVGIGTVSPTHPLHLSLSGDYFSITDSGDSNNDRVRIGESATNGGYLGLYNDAEALNVLLRSYGISYFLGGNVGIGTVSPGYTLDVNGTGRFVNDVTASNFVLSSDMRLKKNIVTVRDGLKIALSLRPVHYDWKDDRDEFDHIGFIAQDMEKVRPELVITQDHKYISYSTITAINNAAIHILNDKVESNEAKIIRLEKRVKKLENERGSI